jgi:adenylate cyclase
MGVEIERRFLVTGPGWRDDARASRSLRQAYLAVTPAAVIRVRVEDGAAAWLTIKSGNVGIARAEFEYPMPVEDALNIFAIRTGALIEKRRYEVLYRGLCWEVDVFAGALAPLVIAEIELTSERQSIETPGWVGREITDDGRYANASLAMNGLPGDFRAVGET